MAKGRLKTPARAAGRFRRPSGGTLFGFFFFAFFALFQPVFQLVDADAAFLETLVVEQIAVQRRIGFDAGNR